MLGLVGTTPNSTGSVGSSALTLLGDSTLTNAWFGTQLPLASPIVVPSGAEPVIHTGRNIRFNGSLTGTGTLTLNNQSVTGNTFEINGEKKSLAWDLHDLNYLSYFDHGVPGDRRGWTNIHATDGDHPYMDKWWVPGLSIGYEHSFVHQAADFLRSIETGESCSPTFKEALDTQKVCDAVSQSAATRSWKDCGVK